MARNIKTISIARSAGVFTIRVFDGKSFNLYVKGAAEPVVRTNSFEDMVDALYRLSDQLHDLYYDTKYNPETYVTNYWAKKREAEEAANAANAESAANAEAATEAGNEPV